MPSTVSLLTTRERPLTAALLILWALLLLLSLAAADQVASAVPGDAQVRSTIRVALVFYGLAAALLLCLDRSDWEQSTAPVRLARWLWFLALAAYLVHAALAFHYYHRWSNADAFERTERITGFGPGIYISHLFGLLWALDVAWWWLAPLRYARRWPWVGWLLHGFLAFIIFNGAVVFAEGVVRWGALAMFLVLAGLFLHNRIGRQKDEEKK